MFETYQFLYNTYLKTCKGLYDPQNPHENLEECVDKCRDYRDKLLGMLLLLSQCQIIDDKTFEAEVNKVVDDFSSVNICHAYRSEGTLMKFN